MAVSDASAATEITTQRSNELYMTRVFAKTPHSKMFSVTLALAWLSQMHQQLLK